MEKQKVKSTEVKCSFNDCNYEWTTLSTKKFVTCPNCLRKIKNENKNEVEEK